jgi:hypothetical protein
MRLTRHAKNRARFIGASQAEVEDLIRNPLQIERDEDGKPLFSGFLKGVYVRVVVALDEPDLIVTIHEMRK